MSIEIIPPGASAVVTKNDHYRGREDDDCGWKVNLMEAVKDAQAGLERSIGLAHADSVKTVKDAQADLERSNGVHYADTVKTVKDAQADLERSAGFHYADTVKTVKDAECNLERSTANGFMNAIQDVKDAETRLNSSAADRFMQTIQDIKDAETRLDRSAGDRFIQTIQDIKDAAKDVALAGAKNVETTLKAEFALERSNSETRSVIKDGFKEVLLEQCENFDAVKEVVKDKVAHLTEKVQCGFADAQAVAYQNQMAVLLQFKDQALLSEKLAARASRELAECCCELKELVRTDGDKTRELINAQEVDRLRERANKAESQLTLLELLKNKI